MKNNILKISFGVFVLCCFAACTSINKFISQLNKSNREDRPFQERKFDSKLWLEGDTQTRGEMSENLRWNQSETGGSPLEGKTRQQVLAILGEPDRKTRGKCCGAGGTFEEEVWLYDIKAQDADSKIKDEHFQIYFTESGKVDELRVALWDDKNPDYYPRIG